MINNNRDLDNYLETYSKRFKMSKDELFNYIIKYGISTCYALNGNSPRVIFNDNYSCDLLNIKQSLSSLLHNRTHLDISLVDSFVKIFNHMMVKRDLTVKENNFTNNISFAFFHNDKVKELSKDINYNNITIESKVIDNLMIRNNLENNNYRLMMKGFNTTSDISALLVSHPRLKNVKMAVLYDDVSSDNRKLVTDMLKKWFIDIEKYREQLDSVKNQEVFSKEIYKIISKIKKELKNRQDNNYSGHLSLAVVNSTNGQAYLSNIGDNAIYTRKNRMISKDKFENKEFNYYQSTPKAIDIINYDDEDYDELILADKSVGVINNSDYPQDSLSFGELPKYLVNKKNNKGAVLVLKKERK